MSSFKATACCKPRQQRREKLFNRVSNLEWEISCKIIKILHKCELSEKGLDYKVDVRYCPRVEAPLQTLHEKSVRTQRWTLIYQGFKSRMINYFPVSTSFSNIAKNYEELVACWRSCSGWSHIQRLVEDHVKSCPRIHLYRRHKVWNINFDFKTIFM